MIHVRCHKCNKKYAVPDDAKGKRIRCRRCQQVIIVSEDVSDWLDAMSYAADKWQADAQDEAVDGGTPPPAVPSSDVPISELEDAPSSALGDGATSASISENAAAPGGGMDPAAEFAAQVDAATALADKTSVLPGHRQPAIAPRVMPYLMTLTLVLTVAIGAFLLVLGLWVSRGGASPGRRYGTVVLGGLGSLALLTAGLLLSWRIARICQDLDRRR